MQPTTYVILGLLATYAGYRWWREEYTMPDYWVDWCHEVIIELWQEELQDRVRMRRSWRHD